MSELKQLKCGVQGGIWGTEHEVDNECIFLPSSLYNFFYILSSMARESIDSGWLTLMWPKHWSREEVAVSLSSSLPALHSRLFSTLALLLYTIYTINNEQRNKFSTSGEHYEQTSCTVSASLQPPAPPLTYFRI